MQTVQPSRYTLKDYLFIPLGCFLSLSPAIILGLLALTALVGGYFYYFVNTDVFNLSATPFDHLVISPDFKRIDRPDGSYLMISYEKPQKSTFIGSVRHITPIRMGEYPILTHDLLVTSGEFADPEKVKTSVIDHHFTWTSAERSPEGRINLLHTVPLNDGIYGQLFSLRNGQDVKVTGLEILKIEAFSPDGKPQGWWQDSGCNTLLVTSIEVQP